VDGGHLTSKALSLKCNSKYNVTIRARTKKGISPYMSSILILNAYDMGKCITKFIFKPDKKMSNKNKQKARISMYYKCFILYNLTVCTKFISWDYFVAKN